MGLNSRKFAGGILQTRWPSRNGRGMAGTNLGDLCGGLSVIGDVLQSRVFALWKWIMEAEIMPGMPSTSHLPLNCIVSKGLMACRNDILDPILYYYIKKNQRPQEIILRI